MLQSYREAVVYGLEIYFIYLTREILHIASLAAQRIFIPYTVGSIFNGRKYLKLRILTNQGKIEKNIKSLNQTTSSA